MACLFKARILTGAASWLLVFTTGDDISIVDLAEHWSMALRQRQTRAGVTMEQSWVNTIMHAIGIYHTQCNVKWFYGIWFYSNFKLKYYNMTKVYAELRSSRS